MDVKEPVPLRDSTTAIVDQTQPFGSLGVLVRVHDVSASPMERTLTSGAIVIGAGLGADIVVSDDSVSRRHLQVAIVEGEIEILDLESRNGTFYQGQRVGRLTLNREAVITLGRVRITLIPQMNAPSSERGALKYGTLVGNDSSSAQLFAELQKLEGSTVPFLIQGEPGTGKQAAARAVHEHSPSWQGPFVVLDCKTLGRTLASETHSARKRSISGTIPAGGGPFDAAHGGTLFLEDIQELAPELQPLLLRALESSTPQPPAISQTPRTRIIASANLTLSDKVERGKFSSDLLAKLTTVRVALPALRGRPSEISLLARRFASEFGVVRLPPKVIEQLENHGWSGNIRELRDVMRAYAAIGELPQEPIQEDDSLAEMLGRVLDVETSYQEQKDRVLNQFIDVYLSMLLERTHGNQSEAARMSGIDRAHLNKMIAKLRRQPQSPSAPPLEAAGDTEK